MLYDVGGGRINDVNLTSSRHFIIGGAAIRPDVVGRAMPIFNHAMETCFGQTEVPQIAICMRAKDWQDPKLCINGPRYLYDKNWHHG